MTIFGFTWTELLGLAGSAAFMGLALCLIAWAVRDLCGPREGRPPQDS